MWLVSSGSANGQDPPALPHDKKKDDRIDLELWVFWFDDKHTGIVDANEYLDALEELKIGSFTWDQLSSKDLSPTASPVAQPSSAKLVSVAKEYKLFVIAIQNLIHSSMVRKGAISLGEFFVFPPSYLDSDILHDILPNERCHQRETTTLLGCTYNIYLNCSNLVLQVDTRRMRIRPLNMQDIHSRGTEIIISPSGERAQITPTRNVITPQMEEHVLRQWSLLFHIPISQLVQNHSTARLPSLISIRTASGDMILYPSSLAFIPTSARYVPATIAGTNGILGCNRGLSEDIGEKWSRWAWSANVNGEQNPAPDNSFQHIDYWNYANPRVNAFWNVFDTLSMNDALTNQSILQKVMSEPILASPLMASKSIATPVSRSDLISDTENSKNSDAGRLTFVSGTSITDITAPLTSDLKRMSPIYATPATDTHSDDIMRLGNAQAADENGHSLTDMMSKSLIVNGNQEPLANNESLHQPYGQPIADITMYESPSMHMTGDGLDMVMAMNGSENMDTVMRDLPGSWDDGLGDLDNFDLNVTEEDFDFFAEPSGNKQSTFNHQNGNTVFEETQMVVGEDPILLAMSDIPPVAENGQVDLDNFLKEAGGLIEEPMAVDIHPEEDLGLSNEGHRMSTHETDDNQAASQPDKEKIENCPENEGLEGAVSGCINQQAEVSEIVYDAEHCVIPPGFAPVRFRKGVDDTKYCDGGKFMYYSPKVKKDELLYDIYRPDYVPAQHKAAQKGDDPDIYDEKQESAIVVTIDDKTGSSSEDESTSDTDSDSGESSIGTDAASEDQWSESIKNVQEMFASRLFGDIKQSRYGTHVDQQVLDYDVPFSEAVMAKSIKPKKLVEEDYKSLDYLCQQAVMGGYPFNGGLEAAAYSGEITEGESAAVVVTRRRELIHSMYGGVGHAPSLPNDCKQVAQEFKMTLSSIFDQNEASDRDPMDILCLDQSSVSPSSRIKGPLNVQQYYDLAETNPAQLKYGKYQVKKRRSTEPNLEVLSPPDIAVCRQDDIIEGSPQMITFWEKLRLEPYYPKKAIRYFALCPRNQEFENAAVEFFKNISTIYEVCLLGSHQPFDDGSSIHGVLPIQLLPLSYGESFGERQMKSYMAACRELGKKLASYVTDNVVPVIYIINPVSALSSHLDLSACFEALMATYMSNMPASSWKPKPVMQLVPAEHVVRSSAFAGYTKFGLKSIAFSVYSKCQTLTSKNSNQANVRAAEAYTPPFVLAKTIPDSIPLSLKPPFENVCGLLDPHRAIHMAYCFSIDRKWMAVVWTDNEGELLEYAVLNTTKAASKGRMWGVFEEAWNRTKEISQRTGMTWTYVIAKLGLMFEKELKVWSCIIPKDESVAIVNVDMESILQVDSLSNQYPDVAQAEPSQCNSHETEPTDSGTTQILLLNHRIAYTRKRERASLGITLIASATEPEDWMLPLATGYLIHTPSKDEGANAEQFGGNPLVLEVSPLYMYRYRFLTFCFLEDTSRMQSDKELSVPMFEEYYQTISRPFVRKFNAII
ncbi:mediator of RNA polymerase II transcription subunit 13 [Apophysomyces ossiformis]|uniref:Mediator of RNA polymerase II transcription subunit 13 n=1 Tax=Apophysomyces ossiformis TaxID=679940 RepID=A0A8H7ET30_9FUNG|nr:mediator of RNA polymerase II transcription subunit 13 [Apophysomyces ossiformis]